MWKRVRDMSNCGDMEGRSTGISRRVALAAIAGGGVCNAQTQSPVEIRPAADPDPLARLRKTHSRLLLQDADLDRIKLMVRDYPLAKRIFNELEKECEKLQTTLPVEYRLNGNSLLAQCRKAVDRIGTLSLMFRITGRESYLHRAVLEMRAAANFKDWNPSHFLDTAEMTHAMALGYDWLHVALTFEERAWIAGAIVGKGLDQALAGYQAKAGWTMTRYYWNPVCNSGILLGALAVAEDFAPKSALILKLGMESLAHVLSGWGSDGGWPEGSYYGDFAGRSMAILVAALETAIGGDLGVVGTNRGFERSARYRLYATAPSGRTFNFGDSLDEPVPAPYLQWIARRFNNPPAAWQAQRIAEKVTHQDFYDLLWFAREAKAPAAPLWPLDSVLRGIQVASFRSSWEDPNAIFLAVKGGDNKVPHTHYDLGSFVLEAGGVRFATDLGPEDLAVQGVLPGGGRPRLSNYRSRTEIHNTLLVDFENQDVNAEAKITRQEFGPELSWVQLDLSKANGNKTRLWQRRIGLAQRQAVLIEDQLESDRPLDVFWGMVTDADITVSGQTATLQKGKWTLSAELRSPRHAVFDVEPLRSNGSRKLIVRLGDKTANLRLNVVLTPYKTGTAKPKTTAQFPV